MIEVRTVQMTWFVETGYSDGCGMGYWQETKESVPCDTKAEAECLRDEWLAQGKLEKTRWGGIRPKFSYGIFRIRPHEEIIEIRNPARVSPLGDGDGPVLTDGIIPTNSQPSVEK